MTNDGNKSYRMRVYRDSTKLEAGMSQFTACTLNLINSFIHHVPFIWVEVVVADKAGYSPEKAFQLLPGDPEAFPGQMGYISPPASSGSTTVFLLSWLSPVDLRR